MTRRTNARVAGLAFLLYIALGVSAMVLSGRAMHGDGIAAKLASIAQHASDMRLAIVLELFSSFCAVALGVTLFAITRDEDRDLAMLAMTFRVGEGVIGGFSVQRSLGLLWLATAAGPSALKPEAGQSFGTFLLEGQGSGTTAAMFFAMGSAIFSWLLLRGRMIRVALAWLGVVASILWVIGLPLQLTGALQGTIPQMVMWTSMALFEVGLALWLIIKGAAIPARSQPA